MMFLFQVIPNPILPPLINLQKNVSPHNIDGWNVALDCNHFFKTNNNRSVLFLLYGFFMYYHAFDFKNNLICPLLGCTLNRETLHDAPQPIEMSRYFSHVEREPNDKLAAQHNLCVQDPHRLSINVTKTTAGSYLAFKQHLKTMCEHIQQATRSSVDTEKVGLLAKLLTMRVAPIPKAKRQPDPDRMKIEPIKAELEAVKVQLGGEPDDYTIMERWMELVVLFYDRILEVTVLNITTNQLENTSENSSNVLRKFTANIDLNNKTDKPNSVNYGTPALERKLKFIRNLLGYEKKVSLQFDITLVAADDSTSITVIVDKPRCGKTTTTNSIQHHFDTMRSFFWSNSGIRGVVSKLFDQLNTV